MKMIRNTPATRERKYDVETTDYKVAKEMANKIMLNNPRIAHLWLGCDRSTDHWCIIIKVYSEKFIEKHSK